MSIAKKLKELEGLGIRTCFDLDGYATPATSYPDAKAGKARLKTVYYKGAYECYGLRGYDYYVASRRIPVKTLQIGGKTWMVDDPPHWWAMEEHAMQYHGRVLVAGLGLGLIVHAMVRNPAITHIKVVEREVDVIDLIAPHLPNDPRIEVVHSDFWNITMKRTDGVFYDLFVGEGRELRVDAMAVYMRLMRLYPTAQVIRIHGFDNDALAAVGNGIRKVQGVCDER